MIRFERTRDFELIASIMSRPELYRWIADDFYPAAENFWPLASDSILYLLAYEGAELLGLVITHPINAVLWEVHHAILPSAWGERAHRIAVEAEQWIWRHTLAAAIVGFTPECNRLALQFARRHGGREVGRIPRAYQRDGALFDLIVFSKSRS